MTGGSEPSQTNSDDGGMDGVCAAARPDSVVARIHRSMWLIHGKNLVRPAPAEMTLAQTRTPLLDVLRFKNHIRPAPVEMALLGPGAIRARVMWTSEHWKFCDVRFTGLKANRCGVQAAKRHKIYVNRMPARQPQMQTAAELPSVR